MNKTQITISIDQYDLASYTDEFIQSAWFVAQMNPASIDDRDAGELAEHIGREIIRRWLKHQEPPLWNHQGRHAPCQLLTKHGTYEGGNWQPRAATLARDFLALAESPEVKVGEIAWCKLVDQARQIANS